MLPIIEQRDQIECELIRNLKWQSTGTANFGKISKRPKTYQQKQNAMQSSGVHIFHPLDSRQSNDPWL